MLVTTKRPRNLAWYHAGGLLFGDWGTSRLYVLGLAFFYAAHASVFYLALMSGLMTVVAWAYTIVCRCFPDGGGVYTAARQINPLLSVIGATLLVCNYIVTASLSTLAAFHYFGFPEGPGKWFIVSACVGTIALIGVVNWLGARSAGRVSVVVAAAAVVVSLIIAVACIPLLDDGRRTLSLGPSQPLVDRWKSFVLIVLALSGVESVANMTGVLKEPVPRTAKKTIWPVLIEVALLNLVFATALNGLPQLAGVTTPDALAYPPGAAPAHVIEYRDTAMEVLAAHVTTPLFAKIAAFVFGLLLLSASNTAVMASVSVLYAMAQDRELPRRLTRLNYSGVPIIPLILAAAVPALVLVFERDLQRLADLYAIGVVGAITTTLLCCAFNRALEIGVWERRGMMAAGFVLAAAEVTIVLTKPHALAFAGSIIAVVLVSRAWMRQAAPETGAPIPEPTTGWLAEIERAPATLDPDRPRIMLAARGRNQADFAVGLAKMRGATLFAIHVRTLRLLDQVPGQVPRIQDDPEALAGLGTVAVLARQAGVPFVPVYVCSADISEEILDYTVTFNCDTLIMGKSTRLALARLLSGDVVSQVEKHLPEGVALITRDAGEAPDHKEIVETTKEIAAETEGR